MMLIGSSTNLWMHSLPHVADPPWYWTLIPWIAVLAYWAMGQGMRRVREEVIVPRAGYVAFPERPSRRIWILGIGLGAGAGFAVCLLFRAPAWAHESEGLAMWAIFWLACALTIAGGWRFVRFLRANPKVEDPTP
jgi:hypothetical protein